MVCRSALTVSQRSTLPSTGAQAARCVQHLPASSEQHGQCKCPSCCTSWLCTQFAPSSSVYTVIAPLGPVCAACTSHMPNVVGPAVAGAAVVDFTSSGCAGQHSKPHSSWSWSAGTVSRLQVTGGTATTCSCCNQIVEQFTRLRFATAAYITALHALLAKERRHNTPRSCLSSCSLTCLSGL